MLRRSGRVTNGVFAIALCGIPVLGFLQSQWIVRVSDAELQRESARLSRGLDQIAAAVDTEITRAHLAFLPGRTSDPLRERLIASMRDWIVFAPFPQLVTEVLFESEGHGFRITESGISYAPAFYPFLTGALNFRGPLRNAISNSGAHPALLATVAASADKGGTLPSGSESTAIRAVVIDERWLTTSFLNDAIERYLPGGFYDFELRSGSQVLLRTGAPVDKPDGSVGLFAIRPECFSRPGPSEQQSGRKSDSDRSHVLRLRSGACSTASASTSADLWLLLARHRSGSLAAAIGSLRFRNMLLCMSLLAALAGALGALWHFNRRATELAQQQLEFAMAVSHELRTPLTVIRLAGDNLVEGVATTPEQIRKYGETVQREAERLSSMVEQVLAFARTHRPDLPIRPEPVSAEAIVDGAVSATEAVLHDANLTVLTEIDHDLPPVCADINLTISALANLLTNAARYAASGKSVRIRVCFNYPNIELEVVDRGPGISKRDLRHIFEPFFRGSTRGRTRGTGLGLHLVRRIVEAQGGNVQIESSAELGTTVRMALPAAAALTITEDVA